MQTRYAVRACISLAILCVSFSCLASDTELAVLKRRVVRNYAAVAFAAYSDSLAGVKKLRAEIDHFLTNPTPEAMAQARRAWTDSRRPYVQTEVLRFIDGPIETVEARINAWPIDEHYIDYVEDDPKAGLINNTARCPKVKREVLVEMNEKEGEKNICLGFHAIEFMLWGQDFNTNGAGNRPISDFQGTSEAVQRRCQYLRIVADLLVQDLETVVKAWEPELRGNYHETFLALPSDEALGLVIKGVGTLSRAELAGERLTVALETKEQEDEHSCFSDTTHLDVIGNAVGIQNIYLGRYETTDGRTIQGPGLRELIAHADHALAEKLTREIETSVEATRRIPPPFDQAILGRDDTPGRMAIRQAIKSLEAQTDSLARAAAVLNIKLNL